jgi:Matrixin
LSVRSIFTILLLVAGTLSLTYSDYYLTKASTDNDNEDFEDQNLIQVCCAWGEELQDGILTYKIDEDDISDEEKAVVRDAIEEWDTKIDRLELEESPDNSDITVEFADGNDDDKEEEEDIAGMTMTTFYEDGFIEKAKITINKKVQGYEFDAKTIGQVAKHEMGHALGLGHANFDNNLMAERVNHGTGFVSECEIKAVIEANYWKLGQNEENVNLAPHNPQKDIITCD